MSHTVPRLQKGAASSSPPQPFSTSAPAGGGEDTAAPRNTLWARATAWARKALWFGATARPNAAAVTGGRGAQPPRPHSRHLACSMKLRDFLHQVMYSCSVSVFAERGYVHGPSAHLALRLPSHAPGNCGNDQEG